MGVDNCYFIDNGAWLWFWILYFVFIFISWLMAPLMEQDFGIPKELSNLGAGFWTFIGLLVFSFGYLNCWGWV